MPSDLKMLHKSGPRRVPGDASENFHLRPPWHQRDGLVRDVHQLDLAARRARPPSAVNDQAVDLDPCVRDAFGA